MLMFEESLYFYLVDQPLDEFRSGLSQRNLLYCYNELAGVMLCPIDISEPSLPKHFSQFELLEERQLARFVQYLGSFGFFNRRDSIGGGEWFICIVDRFDILANLEGRDFNIFLAIVFGSYSFCLELLIILGRDGDVLDDRDVESSLALRIFMCFCFFEL